MRWRFLIFTIHELKPVFNFLTYATSGRGKPVKKEKGEMIEVIFRKREYLKMEKKIKQKTKKSVLVLLIWDVALQELTYHETF